MKQWPLSKGRSPACWSSIKERTEVYTCRRCPQIPQGFPSKLPAMWYQKRSSGVVSGAIHRNADRLCRGACRTAARLCVEIFPRASRMVGGGSCICRSRSPLPGSPGKDIRTGDRFTSRSLRQQPSMALFALFPATPGVQAVPSKSSRKGAATGRQLVNKLNGPSQTLTSPVPQLSRT